MSPLLNEGTDLIMRVGSTGGQTLVQSASPLTRLNYFDGKFLRADDLRLEQNYLRQLVQYSNQGLGAGVVYGMDTTLDAQRQLSIGPGLAYDSVGRTLLITSSASFDIGALIDATRRIVLRKQAVTAVSNGNADFAPCVDATGAPTDGVTPGSSLYVICVGHAESLCGTEDVYGRLCEEACVTATDRPYLVEGVIVRALPLTLRTPLATSRAVTLTRRHLRSLVASAYFEDERHVVESLISGAGLALDIWCVGAELGAVGCVPLGVVAQAGTTTIYLDAWTARRERIEAPARRYWAWRMAMRPWDVYLAQILQFQCQLHEVLCCTRVPGASDDPCAMQQQVLSDAADYLRQVGAGYARQVEMLKAAPLPASYAKNNTLFALPTGSADLALLQARIDSALKTIGASTGSRVLINGGIVELPPAGYLPVVVGTVSVNEQVRRLVGEGLDLRFCVVRPDYVAHALEEAQHMERISMLTGLDDPTKLQEVDILVPNGDIVSLDPASLNGFDTRLAIMPRTIQILEEIDLMKMKSAGGAVTPQRMRTAAAAGSIATQLLVHHGAGRGERLATGGGAFYFAGVREAQATDLYNVTVGMREMLAMSSKNQAAAMGTAPMTTSGPFATTADLVEIGATPGQPQVNPRNPRNPGATVATSTTPVMAAWTSMRADEDPYTLQPGDDTAMSLEIVFTSQASSEADVLLRVLLQGRFRATQAPMNVTTGQRLIGFFQGSFTSQSQLGTNHTDDTSTVGVEVVLLRATTGDTGTMSAIFQAGQTGYHFELKAKWTGQSARVDLALSVAPTGGSPAVVTPASPGQPNWIAPSGTPSVMEMLSSANYTATVPILSATITTSSDALTAGSALRTMSTTGLDMIGAEMQRAALGGPDYEDAALKLLFPPPPTDGDLTVRATLDWVLFQRRRTKRCAAAPNAVAAPPSRRFWLYQMRVPSGQRSLQSVQQALALQPGRSRPPYTANLVDVVEFGGGVSTMITDASLVLNDWTQANPGNSLLYGAIATINDLDASLERGRLLTAVSAISSVSPATPATPLDTLTQAPAALPIPPGADGIILLVTAQQVAQVCTDVYAVTDARYALTIDNGLKDNVLSSQILSIGAKPLGKVLFDAGTDNADQASLHAVAAKWPAGVGKPTGARIISATGDSQQGVYQLQARAVVTALGGTVPPYPAAGQAKTLPSTCPSITIVVSTPRASRIARVLGYRLADSFVAAPLRVIDANPPLLAISFGPDGKVSGFLSQNAISAFLSEGSIIGVDIEFGEAQTVLGDADVRELSVANAFIAAITAAGVSPVSPLPVTMGDLPAADQQYLTVGNQTFDDLIFVRHS